MLDVWNTFAIKQSKIAKASLNDRNNYVSALEKIRKDLRFSQEDSLSALSLFTNELVGDDYQPVKEIKWFKYRYSLLIDSLYIFAFQDKKKGKRILKYLKNQINVRYHKKLDELFSVLYGSNEGTFEEISAQVENWKVNQSFAKKPLTKIAFVANMSAGKSTLINALVGAEVNESKNESCTAKIHYIYNKPIDDGYTAEDDNVILFNAGYEELMEDDEQNESIRINVGVFSGTTEKRICLIDTPGVNSAIDADLDSVSKKVINERLYDTLVYVINAGLIGTQDDEKYLKYLVENADKSNIVFALNKIDSFKKKDSVSDSVEQLKEYLVNLGFTKPQIYPVSARAAYLRKADIKQISLNEDDEDDLYLLSKKLKNDRYSLERYTEIVNENAYDDVLIKTGIINLEQRIFGGI